MTTTALEREVKLDVDADWTLPDLSAVVGVDRAVDVGEHLLVATYHDTADHRLLAARATLRRRTGGHDAGWHLKLPAGPDGARLEVRVDGVDPPRDVPAELVALVTSRTRGAPLAPVMSLTTTRGLTHLLGADGSVLAEVADDRVTARAPGGPAQSWREVEVELVEGEPTLLDEAVRVLGAAGARPAAGPSKLGRALGPPSCARPAVSHPRSLPGLVLAYLRAGVDALVDADARVRLGTPEAVHDLRVATRRLRSALATHKRLLDPALVTHLRAELAHLATVASEARDDEVLLARLPVEAAALPAELRSRGGERHLRSELEQALATSQAALLAELGSARYLALLEALAALVAGAALDTPLGAEPRGSQASVRRDLRRLRAAVRVAHTAQGTAGSAAALHVVRKAAKRARYAAELVAPRVGARADRLVADLTELQDLLGGHQDGVVARSRLAGLAAEAVGPEAAALAAMCDQLGAPDTEVESQARALVRDAVRAWKA